MVRAEHPAGHAEEQPQPEQAPAGVADPQERVGQSNHEEEPAERIRVGLVREVVLALMVARLVEELEVVLDVAAKRLVAPALPHVPEDADLADPVEEREGVGDVGDGDRRDRDDPGEEEERQPPPVTLPGGERPALGNQEEVDREQPQRCQGEPAREVRVHHQPADQAADREVGGPPVPQPAEQEERGEDLEERRDDLVPPPAAHAHVPPVEGEQRHRREAAERAEHQAAEGVDGEDGQERREDRDRLQPGPGRPEHLENQRHVVDVPGGRAVPAGPERRVAAPLEDVERVEAAVGLVHVDSGRDLADPPDAHGEGRRSDGEKEQDLDPAGDPAERVAVPDPRVGVRLPSGPGGSEQEPGGGGQRHGREPRRHRAVPDVVVGPQAAHHQRGHERRRSEHRDRGHPLPGRRRGCRAWGQREVGHPGIRPAQGETGQDRRCDEQLPGERGS